MQGLAVAVVVVVVVVDDMAAGEDVVECGDVEAIVRLDEIFVDGVRESGRMW